MSKPFVGCALLDHAGSDKALLYARVIHIDERADLIVVVPFPGKNKHGFQKNYVRAPQFLGLSKVCKRIDTGRWSVVAFDTPTHWLLTPEQLRHGPLPRIGFVSRAQLRKWVRIRAKSFGLIRQFVLNRTIEEILFDPNLPGWPRRRAAELGLKGCSQVQRALNAYLLGLGERNALLPWYINSGGPGKQKFSKKTTGRPREFNGEPSAAARKLRTLNCNKEARQAFALGWKKYKKPGVSVQQAFARTRNDFFAKSVRWLPGGKSEVVLKPEAYRYTPAQFERWGKAGPDALSAKAINRGDTPTKQEYLRRQGKFSSKHFTANGEALLDSTSCDQTLVSCASRLVVLSSPWRTDVVGASVGYIFGHYVGFESPSASTALMAILHAAGSKVEYCARYGISIEERDWLPMTFSSFSMDNGEGKNQLVMSTLEELQSGASYGRTYDAINKCLQESGHRRMQTHVDHHLPGSTMGRTKRRGEPAREELARLNLFEYLPFVIKRILYFNNEEIITLPKVEMRGQADPTRRGVIEWMIKNGYMASTATDLAALRIKSLPRINGVLHADGLHLFDPTHNGKRLIPELVYRSEWLAKSGLLKQAAARAASCVAHINPSDLSEVWINVQGLKRLGLASADPDMLNMTLLDWLLACRDDRLVHYLSRVRRVQEEAYQIVTLNRAVATANKERNSEIQALGTRPSKAALKKGKRSHTAQERSAMSGMPVTPMPSVDTIIEAPLPPAPAGVPPAVSLAVDPFALAIASVRDC